MNAKNIPKYMISNGLLNYELTTDPSETKLIEVLFTFGEHTLEVDGDNLFFTKLAVRMEGKNKFNIYLKNTNEIFVKHIGGRWQDVENYLIKKNNLLDEHLEYIDYVASKGMTKYECVEGFPI